jgi:hypothetical protein
MVLKCDADQISYSHCHSSNQKWLDSLHCEDEETRKSWSDWYAFKISIDF